MNYSFLSEHSSVNFTRNHDNSFTFVKFCLENSTGVDYLYILISNYSTRGWTEKIREEKEKQQENNTNIDNG